MNDQIISGSFLALFWSGDNEGDPDSLLIAELFAPSVADYHDR